MGTINVVWWNLQNFFDTDNDPISKDFAYTPANGWTPGAFEAKKANLAAALRATHGGAGPELLAVAEIEKDSLLEQLIAQMGNGHLKVVRDTEGKKKSDLRGIDVAIAYDDRKLKPTAMASHLVHLRYRTRDIFEVDFELPETGETLTVMASHWPSRSLGKYRSEPLRIAVAEHISYLTEAHVKVEPEEYERLREATDLAPVAQRWEAKVMVVGDFNDEPGDRSVVDHLRASSELDRVGGETNDIDGFKKETGDYRAQEVFLFDAMWKFLAQQEAGSYFLSQTRNGDQMTRRFQMLDHLVVSRGLLAKSGLRLDVDSVGIFRDALVATKGGRPRPFDIAKKTGTSDHLPVTAVCATEPRPDSAPAAGPAPLTAGWGQLALLRGPSFPLRRIPPSQSPRAPRRQRRGTCLPQLTHKTCSNGPGGPSLPLAARQRRRAWGGRPGN